MAIMSIVKLTPGPAALVSWLALPSSRRMGVIGVTLAILVVSLALSPAAWRDWPTLLIGQAQGGSSELSLSKWAGPFGRAISLGLAVVLMVAALVVLRRGRVASALTMAMTAGILVPNSILPHYPAFLLPVVALTMTNRKSAPLGFVALLLVIPAVPFPASGAAAVVLILVGLWIWESATLGLSPELGNPLKIGSGQDSRSRTD